jgi:hypothetical protein
MPAREIGETYGALLDRGLVAHRDGANVPSFPVFRDRDIERISESLDRHALDFAELLGKESGRVDELLSSLADLNAVPPVRRLYVAFVSGILLGGMVEVFAEDKTFLPPPPRRTTGQYYGWLVEGEPVLAGTLLREAWDSEGYQLVYVGSALRTPRPQLEAVRREGFVLEDADARRFRAFAVTMSRDTLLPFFKTRRADLLNAHQRLEAGRYASFASFFAWYYAMTVQRSVDRLVETGMIVRPSPSCCAYALKSSVR